VFPNHNDFIKNLSQPHRVVGDEFKPCKDFLLSPVAHQARANIGSVYGSSSRRHHRYQSK
jgi:hypothetical protein